MTRKAKKHLAFRFGRSAFARKNSKHTVITKGQCENLVGTDGSWNIFCNCTRTKTLGKLICEEPGRKRLCFVHWKCSCPNRPKAMQNQQTDWSLFFYFHSRFFFVIQACWTWSVHDFELSDCEVGFGFIQTLRRTVDCRILLYNPYTHTHTHNARNTFGNLHLSKKMPLVTKTSMDPEWVGLSIQNRELVVPTFVVENFAATRV